MVLKSKQKNVEELVIFLHLPKTAGTTLKRIVTDQYRAGEVYGFSPIIPKPFWEHPKLDYQLKVLPKIGSSKRIKCIMGHTWFGVHRNISRSCTYITMLRDPVDRVISYYYFLKDLNNKNFLAQKVKHMNFEEFLYSNDQVIKGVTENMQTRYLAADKSELDNVALDKAKRRIMNHFSVVGITEMFDESLVLMSHKLGWKNIDYKKANVTKNRPKKEMISKELIAFIESKNTLDMELYRFAKENLKSQIKNLTI
ncbi:sulfotransferase family 2 domain-containing protein [Halalkalibacter kiskunsagensis]|uniref:Sulfotransferase family 2 domain-containing protein n=1 Tax=Halalkalibacter kiskunsagensis TaxID=1548599 RepID=A0ABV6KAU7_9BACI